MSDGEGARPDILDVMPSGTQSLAPRGPESFVSLLVFWDTASQSPLFPVPWWWSLLDGKLVVQGTVDLPFLSNLQELN